MQIDQTNYVNSIQKKNIDTTGSAVAAMMQDMAGVAQTGMQATEQYRHVAAASESGSVDMSQATYMRPNGKEDTLVDTLGAETGKSAMTRRNEMAVLANTTSSSDVAEAAKDGYDVSDMDSHAIVTVMDKIKANLAKMGVDISDMGGISKKELEAITGNEALASQIASSLKQADLPTSEENMTEIAEACQEARSLKELDDSALSYMLKNSLMPTIGNLYKAEHMQSEGRSASISEEDFGQMRGSIEQALAKAGIISTEENVADCKWMMEEQIAVVPDNISLLQDLKQLSSDLEKGLGLEEILMSITEAIAEGKRPAEATIADGYSLKDRAEKCLNIITNATEEDLAYLVEKGLPITIDGLEEAQNLRQVTGKVATPENKELAMVTAQRQLEETRLVMTSEANLALLKRGISIDTQPLEQVVEELKEQENALAKSLFDSAGIEATESNLSVFQETTSYIEELKHVPAKVLNLASDLDSIRSLHIEGASLAKAYQAAGERYEELMTAPRSDMGDSIKKAFQNVDDILADLGLEASEENRRAVRILAYNETALTTDNIALIKAKDEEVQRVFKNMTPQTVLEMIRRNENPLDMSLEDLNSLAGKIQEETGRNEERFSKFLYELDKKKAITKEERDTYIGIYRLFAQVEKTDGAAIGALVNQGAELTMRNLLTAVRNEKKSGMNYQIDDDFAGVEGHVKTGKIDEQIMTAYNTNLIKDATEELHASDFARVLSGDWENQTIEEFTRAIVEAPVSEEDAAADMAYYEEKQELFQTALEASEDVYEMLSRMDMPNTVDNIMAAEMYMHQPNEVFTRLFKIHGETTEDKLRKVRDMKDEIIDRLGEAIKTPEEMAQAMDELGDLAENVMKTMIVEEPDVTAVDLQELRMLNKALLFGKAQAQEENYVIPMETSDGVITGIALKIVRGREKTGFVDLMLRDTLMGKIAASFEAKEDRISGMIATDDEETRRLLSDNLPMLVEQLNEAGEESVDLRVAYVKDLSLETFGAQSQSRKELLEGETKEEQDEKRQNKVQTSRLYGLAECFINSMKEFGTGSIW